MRLRTFLFLTFCLAFRVLFAQESDPLVIATTIDKGDYDYIPPSALADSVHAIIHPIRRDRKTGIKTRPIEFSWSSTCNDGYYSLTVTPAQIIFSSAHDNPNPNFLFWVIEIDGLQFEQIRNGVRKNPPPGFKNLSAYYNQSLTVFNDSVLLDEFATTATIWNDSIKEKWVQFCDAQLKNQLDRYSSMLNSYIADPANKVAFPVKSMQRKYFGFSKEDIMGWVPVKFKQPNVIEQ